MHDTLDHIGPDDVIPTNMTNNFHYFPLDKYNSHCLNTNFDTNLLNINVKSFKAKEVVLNSLLASLRSKPSFLLISETWKNDCNVNLCTQERYIGFHTHNEMINKRRVSVFVNMSYIGT